MKYLFGPVNSRRLGISLGIDLIPHKTCTLNCVYCECGATTNLTTEIKEYFPTANILQELKSYLSQNPPLDIITFAGQGEPTLHAGLGEIINYLKKNFPAYQVALLTNGTTLSNPNVKESLKNLDLIIPSLDAVSEENFKKILRPHPQIKAAETIEGLINFRKNFPGKFYLEIFIIPQLNDSPEELKLLRKTCLAIQPDKIQLNSLDRPPTENWVKPESDELLLSIKKFLVPLKVEIISKKGKSNSLPPNLKKNKEDIIATLRRRPSTLNDLKQSLNLKELELSKIINQLLLEKIISEEKQQRGTFYKYHHKP